MPHDKYTINGLVSGNPITHSNANSNGEVYWHTNHEKPDFIVDHNDPRYRACLAEAEKLQKQFSLTGLDPNVPKDREIITAREKAIAAALVNIIHRQFGNYNPLVAQGDSGPKVVESLHNDAQRENTDSPASLREFHSGELICRHYAPLFNELAPAAGLKTVCISGDSFDFERVNKKMRPKDDPSSQRSGGHVFLVSCFTANVIDPTSPKGEDAYKPQVNGLTIDEILAGKTIVTSYAQTHFSTYGSQCTGAPEQQAVIDKRLELIKARELKDIPTYSYHSHNGSQAQYDRENERLRESVATYDKGLVEKTDREIIQPLLEKFNAAVEHKDISAAQECCQQYPIDSEMLGKALEKATANEDLPMAGFLIKQGAWNAEFSMAGLLKTSIHKQDWKLAEFALDHGALKGFEPAIETVKDKAGVPFGLKLSKEEKFNPDFNRKLLGNLGVSPEAYFKKAVESNWEQHIQLALELFKEQPKTPEREKLLRDAVEKLKITDDKDGLKYNTKQSVLVSKFIEEQYGNSQQPQQHKKTSMNSTNVFGGELVEPFVKSLPPEVAAVFKSIEHMGETPQNMIAKNSPTDRSVKNNGIS